MIQALVDVLGPNGTLMAPYFLDYITHQEVFNPLNPPPAVTGAIPNCLVAWPEAQLSSSPSHPVVALGSLAELLIKDHQRVSPVGQDSPFDRLASLSGKVLLLGVNQQANTTIHTGEAVAPAVYWGMPRPDRPKGLFVRLPGGAVEWVHLKEIPGHSAGFDKIEPYLRARGIIRPGGIGQAACQLMRAKALIDAVTDYLKLDPAGLLCDLPGCFSCGQARCYVTNYGGLSA